ncbi:MAG: thioesterase family protein [Actinobacteria bacterium]|nr:thioesterase family protein [Actinomycetota bacterium]
MGDFGEQTSVEPVTDGTYRAELSRDWEIWGPMGGYVAAIALRAAGAEAALPRPASFFCHYLGVAHFDAVDISVTPVRRGRSAETLRVSVAQGGRAILDATVCVVADVEGLDHEITERPDVPPPSQLKNVEQILEELERKSDPPFPFWENFESRPVEFHEKWPPPEPLAPVWRDWLRFLPTSTFDDPWTDAARCLLLIDLPSWPAGSRPHAWQWAEGQPSWMAPSLDLYASFHQFAPDDPWLLVDGAAPIATGGLLGWNGRLWSSDFRLVASGGGQALCRRVPAARPT